MRVNLPKKLVVALVSIGVVGVLLGAFFAIKKDIGTDDNKPVVVDSSSSDKEPNDFGTYFSSVFLGRAGDGSSIKQDTPLVRSSKFYVGEKAGIRIQTTSGVTKPITIELRFLKSDTGEETPALQKMRQNVSVKSGLRSYCCISMPKEAGNVSVQIVMKGVFLGSIGDFTILPAKTIEEGGFFSI